MYTDYRARNMSHCLHICNAGSIVCILDGSLYHYAHLWSKSDIAFGNIERVVKCYK